MSKESNAENKICCRLCAELKGRLISPLSIGSGEQEDSDGDVIFNAKGQPCIPGSSLAGAVRSYSMAMEGEEETNTLFGAPHSGNPGSDSDIQSKVFFYDTILEKAEIGIRDGVKLNENKVSMRTAKYDQQIVERGASFTIRIEVIEREKCFRTYKDIQEVWNRGQQWFGLWMNGFSVGELRLGARSQRGFGKIQIEQIRFKKFDMRQIESYMEWLDWDWDKKDAFAGVKKEDIWTSVPMGMPFKFLEHTIEIPLHIPGTLMIRDYRISGKKDNWPDYEQLSLGGNRKHAIIPGSSWAGAFRSRIAQIIGELTESDWKMGQQMLKEYFGAWSLEDKLNQDQIASKIIFEETVIEGGHALPTARIAVDRFTGGTVTGALFETVPWTGGKALLRIRWRKDQDEGKEENLEKNKENGKVNCKGNGRDNDKIICGLLLWAIKDLQHGILSVGGETAVGRGIFEPDEGEGSVWKDGKPFEDKEQQDCMRQAACWVRGEKKNEKR